MGQRLNIEIIENGKVLANAYYHWSGYTSSSLELTQEILEAIEKINYEDRVINAIKLLEETGAGLTDNEIEYAKKYIKNFDKYTFKACTGRNDGLIAISDKGIKETEYWEEARVEINLTNKIVNFKAVWESTKEEFEKDYDNIKYDDIPIYNIKFDNIPFKNFAEFKDLISNLIDNEIYKIRLNNDEKVYCFIE